MARQPLVGRSGELARLRTATEQAADGDPQLCLLYGPRRVGKTFLARHLLGSLPAGFATLYFAATQQAEPIELARFTDTCAEALGAEAVRMAGGVLRSWEHALQVVAQTANARPVVVVIDEYTYLEDSTPGFSSIVQAVWDELSTRGERPRLAIILTGSAVGAVEASISAKGALYGRATTTLRLDPFTLPEAAEFLPELAARDQIVAYAACGGYPLHLQAWDSGEAADDNLRRLLRPGGVLLGAARTVLDAVPAPDGHRRVLTAIGRGRERFGDIASEAVQRIEGPLDALVAAGAVQRRTPVGAPRRAAPRYVIADTFLRFWFTVAYADQQLLEAGEASAVLARTQGRWQAHVAWVYDEAARAHARRLVADSDAPHLLVGGWWTTSGEAVEIDVLGLDGNHIALIGEVKWTQRPDWARLDAALSHKLQSAAPPGAHVRRWVWTGSDAPPGLVPVGMTAFGPAAVVGDRATQT